MSQLNVAEPGAKLAAVVIEKDLMRREMQQNRIEDELTDARLLQKLSMELIREEETAWLYQKIMDAAVVIMQSQYASMQVLYHGSDGHDKLKLLASSGFSPEAEEYWQWVTYVGKILSSAERMSLMIEGVLKYSILNASERKFELVDLQKMLADIQSDLEILIQEKEAMFNISDLPAVDGAQVLVYQLFCNLINNSLKFINPNVNPVITISGKTTSLQGVEYAQIQISDNGIGFDPIHNKPIFDTFTRLHSRDEYDGTGLGLSLCRKIVELHNGTIEAHGEKSIGATFIVCLPLRQRAQSI